MDVAESKRDDDGDEQKYADDKHKDGDVLAFSRLVVFCSCAWRNGYTNWMVFRLRLAGRLGAVNSDLSCAATTRSIESE